MAKLYCTGCGKTFEAAGLGEVNCPECCRKFHRRVAVFWCLVISLASGSYVLWKFDGSVLYVFCVGFIVGFNAGVWLTRPPP